MSSDAEHTARIRSAWQGRVSGCQLGKPVELMSMQKGHAAMHGFLAEAGALPLRDYVPRVEGETALDLSRGSCKGEMVRSEPDDDINYTVLALMLMEEHGLALDRTEVARGWLRFLPVAWTFTAERAAFKTLLANVSDFFHFGAPAGFDLVECSDNAWNDWIGAQIRADLYGWICPGRPALAADLASRDASLSHRDEGVYGAAFVAALGAAIPTADSLESAVDEALGEIPADSDCAAAVALGRDQAGNPAGDAVIRERYEGMSPVHTVNNLAVVVWALLSHPDDFGAAIGEAVSAGLDTDCNGATVGGLWGLQGRPIPDQWTAPWQGRIAVTLAGVGELALEDLVDRTVSVLQTIAE
jgi:ADP-ribosylglycohydrolase